MGGVVGGIGGAAILAGVIAFFYIRSRRASSGASTATQGGTTPLAGSDSAFLPASDYQTPPPPPPQMYQTSGSNVGFAGYSDHSQPSPRLGVPPQPLSPVSGTGLLYNPDDPSTFPNSSGGAPSGSGYAPSYAMPQPQLSQQGRYTGVAEV